MDRAVVSIGGRTVYCDVARTEAERLCGLQGKSPLAENEGMAFVFQPEQGVYFHIASVTFPIDLGFFRHNQLMKTDSLQPRSKRIASYYLTDLVVELPFGWFSRNGVVVGDSITMQKSAFGQSWDTLRTLTDASGPEAGPDISSELSNAVAYGVFDADDVASEILRAHLSMFPEDLTNKDIDINAVLASPETKRIIEGVLSNLRNNRLLTSYEEVPELYVEFVESSLRGTLEALVNEGLMGSRSVASKAAQVLVVFENFMGQGLLKPGSKASHAFRKLFKLYEGGAKDATVREVWSKESGSLNYLDRDAVVRVLMESGYPKAINLLKVATEVEKPDVREDAPRLNNSLRHTPSDEMYGGNQLSADTPGQNTCPFDWAEQLGYDQTSLAVTEHTAPIRPSASRVVASDAGGGGGDIHPGDRVRSEDETDGLKKDQQGLCLEVQGDLIWVKFDGDPLPRWVIAETMSKDEDKDQVLERLQKQTQQQTQQQGQQGAQQPAPAGGAS